MEGRWLISRLDFLNAPDEKMHRYEQLFAAEFGSGQEAFSFWKGRAALYAILKAMRLKKGDEVILPGYTCVVVAGAIRHAGATPVYADIRATDYNIDPACVERLITRRTRAIIAQHTYGVPAQVETLAAMASAHRLALIEDCAHVLVGSRYRNQLLGSFGTAAFFSSQWSKPYTTGLGGMVVTGEPELQAALRSLQCEFRPPPVMKAVRLWMQYALYNRFFKPELFWSGQRYFRLLSRLGLFVGSSSSSELNGKEPADLAWKMAEFQRRAGVTRLESLDANASRRKRLTQYYLNVLNDAGCSLQTHGPIGEATLVRFPLLVANRNNMLQKSCAARVELGTWFETPLHPLPLGKHYRYGYDIGSCPVAEFVADRAINLPLHDRVTDIAAQRVVEFILSVGRKHIGAELASNRAQAWT
jgi:dTDP-4-amino-4,6-dideoxygalactose transaminase